MAGRQAIGRRAAAIGDNTRMFVEPIAHHATRNPHSVAVVLPAGNVTYRQLDRAVNVMASYLAGIVPDEGRAAIVVDDSYLHWLLILGLGRLRATSVSIEPARQETLVPLIRPDVVFTDRPLPSSAGATEIKVSPEWLKQVLAADHKPYAGPRPGPDDPARIVMSSGTTGLPKRVLFTHRQVIDRVKSGVFGQLMRYDPRLLVMVGIDTFGGFGAPIRTWWFGGALCLIKATPENLVARDVRGLVVSPRQLQTLLSRLPPDFVPIPGLSVTVGGSAVPQAVSVGARLRLTPNLMLTYGSTETTTVALCPARMKDKDPQVTGVVVPWVQMEAVDPDGRALAAGEVGEIRIRCPEMIEGYLDDPEATAKHFRDGWFYSGDLGSVSEDGVLRVLGRIDDVLNFSGAKIAPEAVEEALSACPGITDQAVFAVSDQLGIDQPWAAIVAGEGVDLDLARAKVAEVLPWARQRLSFLRVDEIPRNPMGKIERFKLRDLARTAGAKVPATN